MPLSLIVGTGWSGTKEGTSEVPPTVRLTKQPQRLAAHRSTPHAPRHRPQVVHLGMQRTRSTSNKASLTAPQQTPRPTPPSAGGALGHAAHTLNILQGLSDHSKSPRHRPQVVHSGMQRRKVGSHALNIESSRSHSMLTVYCNAVSAPACAPTSGGALLCPVTSEQQ